MKKRSNTYVNKLVSVQSNQVHKVPGKSRPNPTQPNLVQLCDIDDSMVS